MYQFSVTTPTDKPASIKLLRKWSSMGVAELNNAIKSTAPVIALDYRDDLEIMEIPEWCEKVKSIYKELSQLFEKVIIGYAPAIGDEIEYINNEMFHNLIESEIKDYEQEHD